MRVYDHTAGVRIYGHRARQCFEKYAVHVKTHVSGPITIGGAIMAEISLRAYKSSGQQTGSSTTGVSVNFLPDDDEPYSIFSETSCGERVITGEQVSRFARHRGCGAYDDPKRSPKRFRENKILDVISGSPEVYPDAIGVIIVVGRGR
jgi:hypothetical protein